MSIKPFLISLCCAFGSVVCHGQTLYDLSDVYLKNADFNANYDHAVGETGNVAQQICELPGWNKDFSVNYTIAGVYQIGTNKTFNGAKVPDKAFDGTTSGGVLALSTGWEQALKYYQTVTLPAGNYTMKSAFFNGSDKSSGISLMAWLPDGGTPVKSSLTSFSVGNWTEDVVHFTLTETTTGRIQLGFQAPESRGSANVTEQKDGRLVLKELSSEDVLTNDSAAWHVIFNAEKSLYSFKNVATGHVITYDTHTSSMRTGEADGATDDVLFHLMRGRKDVVEGSSVRGYWMIHNDGSESPKVMSAENGSTLTIATYNLGNDATAQRWLILDKNTMESIEMQAKKDYSKQLDDYLDLVKKLRSTPHREDVAGTDKTFDDGLEAIKSRRLTATSAGKLSSLVAEAHALAYNFLSHVTPLSKYEPFDLTFMVMNPGMDQLNGWTGKPALNHSSGEFYQATFDFNQTVSNLPVGSYQLRVQAFQRPGSAETAYQAHMSGDDKVTTEIYLGDRSCKVKQAVTEARETPIGVGNESMLPSNPAKYIPNDMLSASEYFANGLYENNVSARVETENSSLKLGIRCTFSDNMYWSIFDNFRLYYFGNMPFDEVMPVKKIQVQTQSVSDRVFTIDGRAINMHGKGVESLPHGVYIIGGKKVVR
ncbi:hypothetical protein [Segatella salivae]|uniref:hypothetical protein n=1 Tax=Segatella salivae TaxID=228604 RepID=UPI0028E6C97D|nr:hypothetical protein [Segatella salivae]